MLTRFKLLISFITMKGRGVLLSFEEGKREALFVISTRSGKNGGISLAKAPEKLRGDLFSSCLQNKGNS